MNVTIDCSGIQTRDALHRTFAEALALPAWYGKTLDALHDVLTALSGTIRLENWAAAEKNLGAYGIAARKAITHAALENTSLIVTFS